MSLRTLVGSLVGLILGAVASPQVQAQTFIPESGTNLLWNNQDNWRDPPFIPNAVGDSATFISPTFTPGTLSVNFNIPITIGLFDLTNDTSFTRTFNNGSGSLTFDNFGTTNAQININGIGTAVTTISATTTLNDTLAVAVNNTAVTSASGALTLTGAISGSGGLIKTGAGTLSLSSAAKTFTGAVQVQGGILRVSEIAATSSASTLSVSSGAQLRLESDGNRSWTVAAGTVTLNGTGVTGSVGALRFQGSWNSAESQTFTNNISLNSNSTIFINDADGYVDFTGGISGAGALTKAGAGVMRISAAASYGGATNINQGSIRLNGSGALPSGTNLNLGEATSANLGTFDLNGVNQTVAGLNSISGTNATGNKNTITSTTAATLTINGGGAFGNGTAANSGIITGAISLVKSGTGTLTLGDANSYTGTTTINGGTLTINGNQSAATGAVTVSGGTLNGTGTLGGTVTVGASGTIQGGTGSGTGTLTTAGLNLNAAGAQLNVNLASGGTASTIAVGTGSINFTTGSVVKLTGVGGLVLPTGAQWWTIATLSNGDNISIDSVPTTGPYQVLGSYTEGSGATGAVVVDVSALGFSLNAGDRIEILRAGNNLSALYIPIPEPGMFVGLTSLVAGLSLFARRRLLPA